MRRYGERRVLQKSEDPFSFFRTVTVGPGFSPDLRFSLENAPAGCPGTRFTAGGDFHPALRVVVFLITYCLLSRGGRKFHFSAGNSGVRRVEGIGIIVV